MKYTFEEGPRGGRRGGRGRPGPTTEEQRRSVRAWLAGRLPSEWAVEPTGILVDDDEILVVVPLPEVAEASLGEDVAVDERTTAALARANGFREDTRGRRVQIAEEAQLAFGRQVSWGARCGGVTVLFTTASVPVMTRLRIGERQVLDTLIDAGVARSRSEALAWCVRLVGRNEQEWIEELRAAFDHVEQVRTKGPRSAADPGPAE